MMQILFDRLAPAGRHGKLSILLFHRVLPAPDPLFPGEVYAGQFDQICSWVKQWFNVMALDDAVSKLGKGELPRRPLVITFDDGYFDNYSVALPILARHQLPATFYVATGFLNGGRMWNDSVIESVRRATCDEIDFRGSPLSNLGRIQLDAAPSSRRALIDRLLQDIKYRPGQERHECVAALEELTGAVLPKDLMLEDEHIRALHRAGMQIGAHTVTHPILAKLSRQAMEQEIAGSKAYLESLLGAPITQFAYPNGKMGTDYSEMSVEVVRSLGFVAATSTEWGYSDQQTDLYQLRRFTPWDRTRLAFGARMAKNLLM